MVKLYTIDCPKCKVLEMKLDQKNIEYEKLHPPVIYDKSKFKTKNKRKTTKHKQTTIECFDKHKKQSVAERKLADKVSKLNKLNINIKPVN